MPKRKQPKKNPEDSTGETLEQIMEKSRASAKAYRKILDSLDSKKKNNG